MNPRGNVETLRPWKPGQSGNPAGRPKGLRKRIRELYTEEELIEGMLATARGEDFPNGVTPIAKDIIAARVWLSENGWGKAPVFAAIEGADPLEQDEVAAEIRSIAAQLEADRAA